MSYLVLARKFRPQTFESVIGQEHITKALANAIVREKVAHALLFTGPRGVGKTSMARVFARALNCTGRSEDAARSAKSDEEARRLVEPCGECQNCIEIARSSSMAVWEIDGASNNSVDDVRELIESLRSLPPPSSKYKIYIIDEVHMLSTAAFNALLKSLEEPPPHTKFIFATTEPQKIPETVLSRCQRHDFHRLQTDLISAHLEQIAASEGINAEKEIFEFIARRADGGMRDAETLLDRLSTFSLDKIYLADALRVFGAVDHRIFSKLAADIFNQDATACFELLDNAFRESFDLRSFLADFVLYFRNLLLVSLESEKRGDVGEGFRKLLEVGQKDLEELKKLAAASSSFDIQRIFDIAQKTADLALSSNYPRFVIEAGLAKMASLPSLKPISEILTQLQTGVINGRSATSSGPVKSVTRANPISAADLSITNAAPAIKRAAVVDSDESPKGNFIPSWHDFVAHVKNRSEVVLATFLRRVSPTAFLPGRLELHAAQFDLNSLKDPQTIQNLRACLYSYSGIEKWDIRLEEHVETNELPSAADSAAGNAANKARKRIGGPPPGSLAMQESEQEKEIRAQIEADARNSNAVQSALAAFDGSKIEKVSVLKR